MSLLWVTEFGAPFLALSTKCLPFIASPSFFVISISEYLFYFSPLFCCCCVESKALIMLKLSWVPKTCAISSELKSNFLFFVPGIFC